MNTTSAVSADILSVASPDVAVARSRKMPSASVSTATRVRPGGASGASSTITSAGTSRSQKSSTRNDHSGAAGDDHHRSISGVSVSRKVVSARVGYPATSTGEAGAKGVNPPSCTWTASIQTSTGPSSPVMATWALPFMDSGPPTRPLVA